MGKVGLALGNVYSRICHDPAISGAAQPNPDGSQKSNMEDLTNGL